MTSNTPWSVKGVAHEAREAAKIAARKAGQPIRTWLSQTILAAATQELKRNHPGGERPPPSYPAAGYGDMASNDGGGSRGVYYPAPPAYAGVARPPALTTQAVIESIKKLSTRIDAAEERTAAQIKPIVDKVDHLATQIDRVDQMAGQLHRIDEIAAQIEEVKNKSGGPATTAPVERAVMRMSERLQKLEQKVQPGGARGGGDGKSSQRGLFARLFKRG